jgi:hypothetical protein
MNYVKSCKATLYIKNKKITNTELLNFHNSLVCQDSLKVLLNNITLLDNQIGLTKFNNVIRIEENPNEIHDLDQDNYLCRIIRKSTNPKKIKEYPEYFLNIIGDESKNREILFLKQNRGDNFYMSSDKFIILPDISSKDDLFTYKYIDEWNRIKKSCELNFDLICDFLANIQFVLFIKDTKYQEIFDFNKDNIKILYDIKQFIKDFYATKFFDNKYLLQDHQISIFVNSDTKYNFIVFNFIVYLPERYNRYISYIDLYRQFKLDNIIHMIKNGDDLYYFTRVNKKDTTNPDIDCSSDISLMNKEGGYLSTLNKLFGKDIKIFKVLNRKHFGNDQHQYCSTYSLVQVNDSYYEVSIKSITYEILKNNQPKYRTFIRLFNQELNDIITNYSDIKHIKYDNITYVFEELPAVVDIYTKKLDNINFRYPDIFVTETSDIYHRYILPESLKRVNDIHQHLLLHLLWKSEFRRICREQNIKNTVDILKYRDDLVYDALFNDINNHNYDQYKDFWIFTKLLLNVEPIGIYILDYFVFNDNFTFNTKYTDTEGSYKLYLVNKKDKSMFKNIIDDYQKNYRRKYILWYVPNELRVTNYKILHEGVKKLHDILQNKYKQHQDSPSQIDNVHKDFTQNNSNDVIFYDCTNFKELFEDSSKFIYNMRHIKKIDILEIDNLLNKIYKDKLVQIKKNFSSFIHYPNYYTFNILHMHTYDYTFDNTTRSTMNYMNLTYNRNFEWNIFIKYVKIDSIDLNINVLDTDDIRKKYLLNVL